MKQDLALEKSTVVNLGPGSYIIFVDIHSGEDVGKPKRPDRMYEMLAVSKGGIMLHERDKYEHEYPKRKADWDCVLRTLSEGFGLRKRGR